MYPYTQSIKLNPNDARTFDLRADAYRQIPSMTSLQDCDKAVKLDPNDAHACYVRGLVRQKKGDKSGGKADIVTARQFDKVDQQ